MKVGARRIPERETVPNESVTQAQSVRVRRYLAWLRWGDRVARERLGDRQYARDRAVPGQNRVVSEHEHLHDRICRDELLVDDGQ